MTLALIYCRYSPRPTQRAGKVVDTESNAHQEAECRAHCARKDWEVAGVFCDDSKSGKDDLTKRPALADAIAALRPGMVLVTYKGDRLARDTILEEVIRDKVARKRAKVETVICPTDETPEGVLIRKIMSAFAEYRRVSDGLLTSRRSRMHQASGRKMSGIAPFGYADDPKDATRIIPNPTEQAICARVCELAAKGLKSMRIKRTLEADKVMCRGKSEWNRRTIQRIITRGIA